MYEVEYKEKAQYILKKFIEWYKKTFLGLFTDTWIYNEEIIRKNYINKSISFYEEVIDSIYSILSEDRIIWYHPINQKNFSVFIKVKNYNLRIFYIENKINKIREIYNIEFHK